MSSTTTRKRATAVVGALAAAAAAIAISGGTYAAFTDDEDVATVNAAGDRMDLVVGATGDTEVVNVGNLRPGSTQTRTLRPVTNVGTVDGLLTARLVQIQEDEGGLTDPEKEVNDDFPDGELDDELFVTLSDGTTTTERLTVAALRDRSFDLGRFPGGATKNLTLTLELPASVDNSVQSDTVQFRVQFSLVQDTSAPSSSTVPAPSSSTVTAPSSTNPSSLG